MSLLSINPLQQVIEDQIASDQGTLFRKWSEHYLPLMEDAYRPHEDDGLRTHLGASMIGNPCPRALFYGFRWYKTPKHGGRLLRLFNRGHLEEARFLAMLRAVNVEVYEHDPNTGKQFRVKGVDGHYGGALDGMGRGFPGLGQQWASLEMKTHSEKSFNGVKSKGVKQSKPVHYVQMQQGMGFYKLKYCVYMAVNKNTDELYVEYVPFDETNYTIYSERPAHIIQVESHASPPERIAKASLSWFECRFCDHTDVCLRKDYTRVRFGCRTCCYSHPIEDAKWYCSHRDKELSKQEQLDGCQTWKFIGE